MRTFVVLNLGANEQLWIRGYDMRAVTLGLRLIGRAAVGLAGPQFPTNRTSAPPGALHGSLAVRRPFIHSCARLHSAVNVCFSCGVGRQEALEIG